MKEQKDLTNDVKTAQRKKMFLILGSVVMVVALSYGIYYYLVESRYVSTDNAYVGAEIAQVTPSVEGIIKEIHYKDTDAVKAGDVLVVIDDTDHRLTLANAEADLIKAQTDFDRTKTDYDRRAVLLKTSSISEDEVRKARYAFESAEATLMRARTTVQQAKIDLSRTMITSPIQGVVAKRQVQLGQRVQAGTVLMSVVPIDQVYVNANFKEVQLKDVRIGQPAELTSDLYGSSVIFHGKVVGISAGTGAAFSVIPAQNATGNWIKVIQRLPVRIEVDSRELAEHSLQVGLSMKARVDVSVKK